ncbi:AbrB family transcriptional regulator [Celeribacter litoreus]|uniref:AbrB family transcriptional regulator n=1 Tax=Celeribacter litoreus TaxID=2876714 RepID=UPI001CCFCD94|nr:AbrB family transcriptional regulator [Celeribacter litoreus]MCA0043382.1 AbrB family transcriptional regulator [Celeribacter litoreus]
MLKTLLVYPLTAAGGYLFYKLGLPLPWMIGPIIVAAAIGIFELFEFRIPVQTRPFGQMVVASQVGLSFSPAVFASLLQLAPLLVGMAIVIIITAFLIAIALSRMARVPLTSAMIATLPTSPVEAAIVGERYGFPPAPIILSQTMRISLVVVLIPMAIFFIDGETARVARAFNADYDIVSIVSLLVLSGIGMYLFRKLKISNPFFLGPLAFSSAITAAGIQFEPYPSVILWAAQVVLGTWLGSNFRRSLFSSAGRMMVASVVSTFMFIAASALIAAGLSVFVDLSWETLVLASTPGGVTEMALTAKFLGIDVALITAFHLTRIFIVIPSIPFIIDRIHRLEGR